MDRISIHGNEYQYVCVNVIPIHFNTAFMSKIIPSGLLLKNKPVFESFLFSVLVFAVGCFLVCAFMIILLMFFSFGKVTKSVPTAQAGKNPAAPGWSAGEMWIFACMGLFEQF